MTLLEAVQDFTAEIGFDRPSIVVSSTDAQIKQFQGIANMVCADVVMRPRWQALTRKASWEALANVFQGSLSSLTDVGFRGIIPKTLWNETTQERYLGPLTAEQRAERDGGNLSYPDLCYYVANNGLYLTEAPTAGDDFSFQYHSAAIVRDADTATTFKRTFTKDNDVFLLDENILKFGLHYFWRLTKGLPYAEFKRMYEQQVSAGKAVDAPPTALVMHGTCASLKPSIQVPAGSWNIS